VVVHRELEKRVTQNRAEAEDVEIVVGRSKCNGNTFRKTNENTQPLEG